MSCSIGPAKRAPLRHSAVCRKSGLLIKVLLREDTSAIVTGLSAGTSRHLVAHRHSYTIGILVIFNTMGLTLVRHRSPIFLLSEEFASSFAFWTSCFAQVSSESPGSLFMMFKAFFEFLHGVYLFSRRRGRAPNLTP